MNGTRHFLCGLVGVFLGAGGLAAAMPELNLRLLNGPAVDYAAGRGVKVQVYPTNPADVTVPVIVRYTVTESSARYGMDYTIAGRISIVEPSDTDPFLVIEPTTMVDPVTQSKGVTITLAAGSGYTIGNGSVEVIIATGEQFPPTVASLTVVESSGSAVLSWPAVTGRITAYSVERGTDNATFLRIAEPTQASYTDSGLAAGTYYYRVRAFLGRNEGGASPVKSLTIAAPQAPAAPSGLAVSNLGASTLTLTWTDNSDNETGFLIERDAVQIATVGAGITTYADSGLSGSTAYVYRVRATNAVGNSAYSATATTTTLPSSIAAPSGLAIGVASATALNLTWFDNASIETSQQIQRSTDQVTWSTIASALVPNTVAYQDNNLTPATTYYYRVRALSSTYNLTSAWSTVASGTTAVGVPPIPTGLAASVGSTTNIVTSWQAAANATTYDLQIGTSATTFSQTFATTALGLNVTNLTADTTYYLRVRARNSSGASAYTTAVSAATPRPTPPPVETLSLAGSVSGLSLNLSWAGITGATRYEVQLANPHATNWVTITNTTASAIGLSDSGSRIIAPVYAAPSSTLWTTVQGASSNVVGVVIINPANGPGTARQAAYGTGIAAMRTGGKRVAGFVQTRTTTDPALPIRTAAAIQADILAWRNLYGADGVTEVFLADVGAGIFRPERAADLAIYQTVSQYCRDLGLRIIADCSTPVLAQLDQRLLE